MKTSWHGNPCCITDPLLGESTGHYFFFRWAWTSFWTNSQVVGDSDWFKTAWCPYDIVMFFFVCPPIFLSVYPPTFLSVYLQRFCLSSNLSVCLSFNLSVSLCVCPSTFLSLCVSVLQPFCSQQDGNVLTLLSGRQNNTQALYAIKGSICQVSGGMSFYLPWHVLYEGLAILLVHSFAVKMAKWPTKIFK